MALVLGLGAPESTSNNPMEAKRSRARCPQVVIAANPALFPAVDPTPAMLIIVL